MSLPDQEANSLDAAWHFLLALSSGEKSIHSITELRLEARQIAKHYPLAAGSRWLQLNGMSDED